MNLLVNNEANECVELLINTLAACHFKKFIECVNKKENWTAELCWCFLKNQMIIKSIINLKLLRVILIECLIMIFGYCKTCNYQILSWY